MAVCGLLFLGLYAAAAAAAPLVASAPADEARLERQLLSPGADGHPFGTDLLGRDLFARVLTGGRIALLVGLAATAVSLTIGVAWGAVAGFVGGRVDRALMRVVDVLYGLPYVVFVIVLVLVFGRGLANLFVAIGAVQWLSTARMVRAQVLQTKSLEFVESARALGAGPVRILVRHILPGLLGPAAVYAALTVPAAMRQEAFLSFLGLGVEPPAASLGTLLAEGVQALNPVRVDWWLIAFPAGALFLTIAALHVVADDLRDRLDPRAIGRGGAGRGQG